MRGASEASVEQLTGQTFLQVRVDPQAIARYGLPTRNVLNVVEAVGSRRVGDVREGQRRFPLVVRLPDRQRTDPDALAKWDGVARWNPAWNRDHSLATAIRESVVWFFMGTAEAIGRERMRGLLAAMDYGNVKVEGELTTFWLDDGSLRITGDEQLDFMTRMVRRELPGIERAHVDTVERLMLTDRALMESRLPEGTAIPATQATIHAKTGTATGVSWWTGRVTGPRGDFVFVSRVLPPGEPIGSSPAMAAGLRALVEAGAL